MMSLRQIQSYPFTILPEDVELKDVDKNGELLSKAQEYSYQIQMDGKKAYIYSNCFLSGDSRISFVNQGSQWYLAKESLRRTFGSSPNFDNAEQEFKLTKKVGLAKHYIKYAEHNYSCRQKIMIMEWIPGMSLAHYAHANTLMSPFQKYKLVSSMHRCVEDLYPKYNLIHRDIKPANFMVKSPYEVVAIDYGMSVEAAKENSLIDRVLGGTSYYIASELTSKDSEVCGINIDKFSFGMCVSDLYDFINPTFKKNIEKIQPGEQDTEETKSSNQIQLNIFDAYRKALRADQKRTIEKSDEEFKLASPLLSSESKEKILDYVTALTHPDPQQRPKFRSEEKSDRTETDTDVKSESEIMLESAHKEIKKIPITKAIIDLEDINNLLKSEESSSTEEKKVEPSEKAKQFRRALLAYNFVIPALSNMELTTIIDRSEIYRFLTKEFTSEELRKELGDKEERPDDLERTLVALEMQIYSKKGGAPIGEIIAEIPEYDKEKNDECETRYYYVTSKTVSEELRAKLASKHITVITPDEILKIATAECPQIKDLKLSTIKSAFFTQAVTKELKVAERPEITRTLACVA